VDAIVAGDTTNGAGRPLLEREILDPAAPILKVGGLGDPFQVSDEAEVGIGRFCALFLRKKSQFPRLLKHYLPLLSHYPPVLV
jgi:hypothetical protein